MDSVGRRTAAVVAAILLLGIAGAWGATTLLLPRPAATDDAGSKPAVSFPPLPAGLDAILVPDAIQARAAGVATDMTVAGWFQQPFPLGCPAPVVPEIPNIEGCPSFAGWLLAQPELVVHHQGNQQWTSPAKGPSIDVVFDGPRSDWERPLPADGDASPTSAVLVGHFHDPRAARCQPANRQECDTEFVVTRVAWADGVLNP